MAKSKKTKHNNNTDTVHKSSADQKPNAVWFKPVMFGLMIIGFLWIIVYYISFSNQWPIPKLGQLNILVGFVILLAGFLMTTRWKS